MADKTIKHFVFSRFFPSQDPKYPHDVLDTDFLSTQVSLAKKNILSSLENQSNKNFELVFTVNPAYFDNAKYEFIFSALRDSTTLSLKFIKTSDIVSLIKPEIVYNDYNFVIQSRMDFDDFVFKDAVADTQAKVNECENILGYGYCSGYTYFNGELYFFSKLYEGKGHVGLFQSLILKSEFAKRHSFVSVFTTHTKLKDKIEKFIDKNGEVFSESMFKQNISTNAFIYFRHDTTRSNKGRAFDKPPRLIKNAKKLTDKDITKKQLEDEFGFHYDLKSIK